MWRYLNRSIKGIEPLIDPRRPSRRSRPAVERGTSRRIFKITITMLEHDVIIVGGGLAGCRAAVEIARTDPSLKVAVVAKTHPIRSHSVAAQGGMASSLQNVDPDDDWKAHAFDTVKGSDYLADQDAVEILTREAPGVVIDLEHMGVLFSRLPDGRIAQRAFGGHSHRSTC